MRKDSWMAVKCSWTVTVLTALSGFALTGCTTKAVDLTKKITTQHVQMPTSCDGWEKIELKNRTRYYLAKHDQRLLINIDAHNLRGRNLGCWSQ